MEQGKSGTEKGRVPAVSIVVPVYNAERFLPVTLDALRAQTLTDWEAILVDDGSSDGSLEICRDYAGQDSRIRVESLPNNSGPVAARNRGVQLARGTYIGFLDSDDIPAPELYETLLRMIRENQADIAAVQLCSFSSPAEITETASAPAKVYTQEEFAKIFFKIGSNRTVCYMPNKLYRREVAAAACVPEHLCLGEDVVAMCQMLLASKRIVESDQVLYWYRKNPSSLTGSATFRRDLQLMEVWDTVVAIVAKQAPQYLEYARLNRVRIAMTLLYRMHTAGADADYPEEEARLRRELRQNAAMLLRSPIPLSRKGIICGYCGCYGLTKAAMKFIGKIRGK